VHLGDGGPGDGGRLPVSLPEELAGLLGEFLGTAEMLWSGHGGSSRVVARFRGDTQ
jgi:hypothetical protein